MFVQSTRPPSKRSFRRIRRAANGISQRCILIHSGHFKWYEYMVRRQLRMTAHE